MTKLPIFFACALLLLIWGCSTTNHAILPTQAYLDITSHYNAYFNANEKLKNSLQVCEESRKDKYDSVLSVYFYNDPKDFAPYSGDLEDVIKRSTLAIQLKGASNWSDDHFLLIGIANYLKGDYDKASSSFKYITTEYKEGVDYVKVMRSLGKKVKKYVKAKKKAKKKPVTKIITLEDGTKKVVREYERPRFSLWVHEPARAEALIWLVKTYSRQKKYDAASSIITYIRSDNMFYENLDADLDLAEADLMVSKKDYAAAIAPLTKYLDSKRVRKNKKKRVRPLFVLAQCYQATGDYLHATEAYKQVLKSRPNYDMEFYAKMRMAKIGRNNPGGIAEIQALLIKMGQDGKYKEYWDQIFYELALIQLEQNQTELARKLLEKSIKKSISNDDQKALSFLKLAELDYADESYVQSKYNYDSTMLFMAKNDPRYGEIAERNKMLDYLVKQLETIHTEDSLQALAALSPEDLKSEIEKIANRIEEEAQKKKEEEEAQLQSGLNQNLNNNQNNSQQQQNSGTQSSWYFYNTTVRASGYNDFIRRWGRRKLEDNWRRKNKSAAFPDEDLSNLNTDSASSDSNNIVADGTLEEKLLAGVPTTPERITESSNRMIDAYYTAGTIYKDGLENYPKAIAVFEELNERFPGHRLLLESNYNLYLIALRTGDAEKAAELKQSIIHEFPESVIAQVLKNPNYINEARKKEQAVFDYYESAFQDYATGKYDSAWYKCIMADNLFKPNPISAKFDLLNAMTLAKQNRLADYVQALNKIINTTTDEEVKQTANDLLSGLNRSNLQQIDLSKDSTQRAALNARYSKPDSSQMALVNQLNAVKEQAKLAGKEVKVDTASNNTVRGVSAEEKNTGTTSSIDTTTEKAVAEVAKETVVMEDTTSPYTRTDDVAHYFIIYIKDPALPQSVVMSTIAKINAFNSTQFEKKRLITKQVMIDSKNKLINVRQFKDRTDVMEYYRAITTQMHLFNEMKPEQYVITCISTANFGTLLTEKDIDTYQKYFNRVYK